MDKKISRKLVYEHIDGERDYQDMVWNPDTTSSHGNHSWEEWFCYMEDYIREAEHILSRQPKQTADIQAAHIARKVAALAVAALENLGSYPREV